VSRDWELFSSETGGFTAMKNAGLSLELQQAMFIGMDPPKHDRIKALFQKGLHAKRIAEHEDAIRAITINVLDQLEGRESCDLVGDVAQPVVARVIGASWAFRRGRRGVGGPDERDRSPPATRRTPEAHRMVMERLVPQMFERGGALIASAGRRPTDDLTSCSFTRESTGAARGHEMVDGVLPADGGRNDSTKATTAAGCGADGRPDQRRQVLGDPALVRPWSRSHCACSRPLPTSPHGDRDTELHGSRSRGREARDVSRPPSRRDAL